MVALAEQWTTVPPQHICKSQEIAEERCVKLLLPYDIYFFLLILNYYKFVACAIEITDKRL